MREVRNKSYAEMPVGTAFLTDVLPVYPLIETLAFVPDLLLINPIQFWGFDIWRGKGTVFQHESPASEPSWIEGMLGSDY